MNKYDVEFRDEFNNFYYINLLAENKKDLMSKLEEIDIKSGYSFFNYKETKDVLVVTRNDLYNLFLEKKNNIDEGYSYFSDLILKLSEDYGGDWSALPDGKKTINSLIRISEYFSRRYYKDDDLDYSLLNDIL